jgi:hypothetical protein
MYLEKIKNIQIVSGTYACFPNSKSPYMVLPFYDKQIFIQALNLVKNNSFKFKLFKTIYKYFWFLFKNIHFGFDIIDIESNQKDDNYHSIIFPPYIENNKLTMIKFNKKSIFIRKQGFNKINPKIDLEYYLYKKNLKKLPIIINYSNEEYKTILDIKYFEGDYPKNLTKEIQVFMNSFQQKDKKFIIKEHPFYNKMLIELDKYHNSVCSKFIKYLKAEILKSDKTIETSLMHGDFSLTNILVFHKEFLIFDWEHYEEEGLPIDINYFKLRNKLDKKCSLELNSLKDKLTMLYYFYFIQKNKLFNRLDVEYLAQELRKLDK